MKAFILIIFILSFFTNSNATPSDVTCSQIDFLFYDSQCCDSSNSVSCLKQLNKIEYDQTIGNLQSQINGITSNNDLSIAGVGSSLKIQSQATLDVHSDSAAAASKLNIMANSQLVMGADSVLDLSAISLTAGETSDNRAIIDNVQVKEMTGKDNKISLDDPLHANKGIKVDEDRFTVADVSGNVESKGNIKAWGEVNSGSLNINDKLKVTSDGRIDSVGAIHVQNDVVIQNGVDVKLRLFQDGTLEAKGLVDAKNGLKVRGAISELNTGISVNTDRFTVDGATGDVTTAGKLTVADGADIGGLNKQNKLIGITEVPTGSKLIVQGQLDVTGGTFLYAEGVTTATLDVGTIASDVDWASNKITNVKLEGQLDGPVGDVSPDSVKATTISTTGEASLASANVAGSLTVGAVTVDTNNVAGVASLQAATVTATGNVAVGGNAAVTGTLGVTGATTLAATTAASITVDGAATMKGAVAMEGDVTFEKKMIVNEELQIGTGVSTPDTSALAEENKKCKSVVAVDDNNDFRKAYITADDTATITTFTSTTAPTICGDVALYILNNGGVCRNAAAGGAGGPLLNGNVYTAESCAALPGDTFTWLAYADYTGDFHVVTGSNNCAICGTDGTETDASYDHYKATKGGVAGAVDFAKDGTLKTSGKATLASMEVVGDSVVSTLTASGDVTVVAIKQSDPSKFSVSSGGNVNAVDLTVSGTADVAGAVALSATLSVASTATFNGDVKTVDGTGADGVVLKGDGKVEAKLLEVSGPISGKDGKFSVNDIGEVTAANIQVTGRLLPMFQEATSASCTVNDGVIMFAKGSCALGFREWRCGASGTFTTQGTGTGMGDCSDTITSTASASCVQGNEVYCEEIKTRSQCKGAPVIVPKAGSTQGAITTPAAQVWTPTGVIELKLCMGGSIVAVAGD